MAKGQEPHVVIAPHDRILATEPVVAELLAKFSRYGLRRGHPDDLPDYSPTQAALDAGHAHHVWFSQWDRVFLSIPGAYQPPSAAELAAHDWDVLSSFLPEHQRGLSYGAVLERAPLYVIRRRRLEQFTQYARERGLAVLVGPHYTPNGHCPYREYEYNLLGCGCDHLPSAVGLLEAFLKYRRWFMGLTLEVGGHIYGYLEWPHEDRPNHMAQYLV